MSLQRLRSWFWWLLLMTLLILAGIFASHFTPQARKITDLGIVRIPLRIAATCGTRIQQRQTATGSAFSGSMPSSWIAFATWSGLMSPRLASWSSAVSVMNSASTSK